jgi:hypothetical protein
MDIDLVRAGRTQIAPIPYLTRRPLDFHKKGKPNQDSRSSPYLFWSAGSRDWRGFCAKSWAPAAPIPGRYLWNSCSRLKKQIVTIGDFSLTEKIEGVQQDRSLTAS